MLLAIYFIPLLKFSQVEFMSLSPSSALLSERIGIMEDSRFILAYFLGESHYSQKVLKIFNQYPMDFE